MQAEDDNVGSQHPLHCPQLEHRPSSLRIMWFCACFKTPTQGVLNHSFLTTGGHCHSVFVIFFEGFDDIVQSHYYNPVTRWQMVTEHNHHTETLTLGGLINSLWWTMKLGIFPGASSAATVLNKQHFHCWRKSTHELVLTVIYVIYSWVLRGMQARAFFSLFSRYCAIEKCFSGCFKVTYSLSKTSCAWEKYISLGNKNPPYYLWMIGICHGFYLQ